MPLLRLNEHYNSVQGEGPNTGKLTQFVRFSGCNMRCPGWPCDTLHAVLPELYRNDPKMDSTSLVAEIVNKGLSTGAMHVCITGGEPFMQDNVQLKHLCLELLNHGMTVDIFTNGSFLFPSWTSTDKITLVMDWKLPGSGEAITKLENRTVNLQNALRKKDAVKFVVKDEADLEHIVSMVHDGTLVTEAQVWIGRVWESPLSNDDLIAFMQSHSYAWSLNVQMHKYLWPNIERGI